jgi:hypothetical protein
LRRSDNAKQAAAEAQDNDHRDLPRYDLVNKKMSNSNKMGQIEEFMIRVSNARQRTIIIVMIQGSITDGF